MSTRERKHDLRFQADVKESLNVIMESLCKLLESKSFREKYNSMVDETIDSPPPQDTYMKDLARAIKDGKPINDLLSQGNWGTFQCEPIDRNQLSVAPKKREKKYRYPAHDPVNIAAVLDAMPNDEWTHTQRLSKKIKLASGTVKNILRRAWQDGSLERRALLVKTGEQCGKENYEYRKVK